MRRVLSMAAIAIALLLGSRVLGDAPKNEQPARRDGPALRIASKAFTESVILGEIASQLAATRGLKVRHERSLGGTRLLWDALLAGDIDLYPEYSGTLVEEILANERAPGVEPNLAFIRERLAAHDIGVSEPLGFEDNYALGMTEKLADKLDIHSISDLATHPQLRLGFSNEFMSRNDGWPKLRERYGLPHADVRGLDHDLAYRALADGSIDVTDLYSTDAEIAYYGLHVLRDDQRVFPRYEAVFVYRLARAAALAPLLDALPSLRIDEAQMRSMNAQVKLDRRTEANTANAFLAATLGIEAQAQAPDRVARITQRTLEHLTLVGASLLAAIVLAVPLGVLAHRRPRLGRITLDLVGLIQTIPSLALLVFMIPLLGIGTLPAAMALFLYSLLPIVRNTHAGLASVPHNLRESAEALGMPRNAVLRLVELPIATRTILAGIQSAAVINVGTATLGALIGAGGLGQSILTGIRLDDTAMILEGAIPASLLALLVERGFTLLERAVVSPGLKLGTDPLGRR